jgi:hypothetical protein
MKGLLDKASLLIGFIAVEEGHFRDAERFLADAQDRMRKAKANAEAHRTELRHVLTKIQGELEAFEIP